MNHIRTADLIAMRTNTNGQIVPEAEQQVYRVNGTTRELGWCNIVARNGISVRNV